MRMILKKEKKLEEEDLELFLQDFGKVEILG